MDSTRKSLYLSWALFGAGFLFSFAFCISWPLMIAAPAAFLVRGRHFEDFHLLREFRRKYPAFHVVVTTASLVLLLWAFQGLTFPGASLIEAYRRVLGGNYGLVVLTPIILFYLVYEHWIFRNAET